MTTHQRYVFSGPLYGVCVLFCAVLARLSEAAPASSFDEVGRFYVENFAPEDYGALPQNWAMAQSLEGLVYVANGEGVLEYDGASWRLIPVADHNVARSLALGLDGRIYVGSVGEIGYLSPDSAGAMRYVSMVEEVPLAHRDFADVWRIEETSEGLFFQSGEQLLLWNGREISAWDGEARFTGIFALDGALYVQQEGLGLMRMREGVLAMAPGGGFFQTVRLSGLVAWDEGWILAITRNQGLYRCPREEAESACVPFRPDLTQLLARLQPRCVTSLAQGRVAIATARGGVVLLDREGELLRIVNESSGLRSHIVWASHLDRQGGLWLGLNDGLARVEVSASVTTFDKTLGLPGSVSDVVRHRERLYAATPLGVSVLEAGIEGRAPRFVAVPGVEEHCWALLSTQEGLLAGCFQGVYNLDQRRLIWPLPGRHVLQIHRSKHDSTQLFLGLQDGLARMELRDGVWSDAGRLDAVRHGVRTIAEDDQGRIWLGIHPDGLLLLELAASADEPPEVSHFGPEHGLPMGEIRVAVAAGEVKFTSSSGEGLFRAEPRSGKMTFVPDDSFSSLVPRSLTRGLIEDARGRLWFRADEASGVARPTPEGGYTFSPVNPLRRTSFAAAYGLLAEAEGPTWQWGPHGIFRIDTESELSERRAEGRLESPEAYPVWLRRVTAANGASLYEGHPPGPGEHHPGIFAGEETAEIAYEHNALRFTFAAPRYDASERTQYRTRLGGFEAEWSDWTEEVDRDFTNLWEGQYAFRVQARDAYGLLSQEDSFGFRVLPPWYRSWWAYALYASALAAIVAIFLRSHRRKLTREREATERERAVSRRLREVDRLKDEFLANTSHELRTPLFGITGIAESLIDGATGELPQETKENLALVVASGQRLSHLVNDILDFSKMRHKSLELDCRPIDLHPMVDVVLTLSATLVGAKGLRLVNAVAPDLPAVDADEDRLQQILFNLVGNAIKFTEEGHVEVSADREGERLVVRVLPKPRPRGRGCWWSMTSRSTSRSCATTWRLRTST